MPHLGLCGSAVLVCATHVDAVVAPGLAVPCVAVSAEHAPNDVPQMWHIVDVWQCAGDKDIPSTYKQQAECVLALAYIF